MLRVSVSSGVTPHYPPDVSSDNRRGRARRASFLLWKVCGREEYKPSLCSEQSQWPPGTTLLWEQKPSLASMDRWAVCQALASVCELVRQVGNSQANKWNPVP